MICSSSLYFLAELDPSGAEFSSPLVLMSPAGEMGIVSRGTGEEGFAELLAAEGASRVAMVDVVWETVEESVCEMGMRSQGVFLSKVTDSMQVVNVLKVGLNFTARNG